ncbi:hypothetical protein XENTR_v10000174 [Xenopus tropicalis]|nr:hypothetical protein XENTR_v10000174 [Xenopus tropicalis]
MAAAKKGAKPKVAGVRFAAGFPEEGAHNHVHFDEQLHDSVVMVSQQEDGNFLVKVGFLKILHKYEISFSLPPVQRLGKSICAVPLPTLNLKVLSITSQAEDRHHGTPMLLEGVRCTGTELEYDSEQSDWHGFD